MDENDKNKDMKTDAHQVDDDIDNLSDDEKSAFEKIMAEIASAEDKPAGTKTEAPSGQAAEASTTQSRADGQPSDPLDQNSSAEDPPASTEESAPAKSDQEESPEVAEDSAAETTQESPLDGEEELTDDQQVALDKIMAEIEGKPESDQPTGSSAPTAEGDGDENLSDDQQAALDKIMSEIKDDKASNNTTKPEAAQDTDKDDDPDLSDEQQAAMDKIMAEIKDGNTTDDPPEAETAQDEGQDDEQDISDEQQAALDKIMAEINDGKATDDPPEAETAQDEGQDDDQDMSDEQQAALDKIMADIKSNGAQAETTEENVRDSADTPDQGAESSDLSIDEFNDELTNLLSSVDQKPEDEQGAPSESVDAPTKDSEQSQETQNAADDSPEQINAALKQIVNEEPAPEPSAQEASDGNSDAKQPQYTMLKEVEIAEEPHQSSVKKNVKSKSQSRLVRNARWVVATVTIALSLAGLGFWGYRHFTNRPEHLVNDIAAVDQPEALNQPDHAVPPAVDADDLDSANPANPVVQQRQVRSPFADLKLDLESARNQLLDKKQELQELKAYYQKGILEEQTKISDQKRSAKFSTYKAAIRDSKVELALRSIQRRSVYIKKIETPLRQVKIALEELLYWQRRTHLLELLNKGISGLPIAEFKQEVQLIMQQHLEVSEKLSIEKIKVAKPSLESIWKDMAEINTDHAGATGRQPQLNKTDVTIGREICKGKFDQLYLLKNISDEVSACLAQWSGKDLYLNGLTQLTPAVAKSLAQWPGERLSLNNVKTLSAESAKHLSKWPGRWLSLNGVKRLSKDATAYLAQWQGDQLEMVGLETIGRWENYVTRLYLSEDLRKKLEMQ